VARRNADPIVKNLRKLCDQVDTLVKSSALTRQLNPLNATGHAPGRPTAKRRTKASANRKH
jgi:hypothetical protein